MRQKDAVEQHKHTQRMPLSVWEQMRAKAWARGLTVNAYINQLIADDLQRPERKTKRETVA